MVIFVISRKIAWLTMVAILGVDIEWKIHIQHDQRVKTLPMITIIVINTIN